MPTGLIAQVAARHGLPAVDTASVDRFLTAPGEAETAILFFTGDPVRWPEANDVMVVLPQLVEAFAGRLRPAIVTREAEAKLMQRFGVNVLPSLALVRHGRKIGVVPKIQDWSTYVERIGRLLDGAQTDAEHGAATGGTA